MTEPSAAVIDKLVANAYHWLFTAATDPLLIVDAAATIVQANEAAGRLFGYPIGALAGMPLEALLPPGSRAGFRAGHGEFLAGHGVRRIEAGGTLCGVRADGSEFAAAIRLSPLEDGMSLAAVQDRTEHRRASETLRKFSRAIEQTASTVVITDAEGVIEYVNPSFTVISGYTAAEAIGQRPSLLKTGHTTAAEYHRLWETIQAGGVWQGEFLNRRKDGTLYWESAIISPVRDEQGRITHFVGIKDDITERKQAEEALRKSKAQLRTFVRQAPLSIAMLDRDMNYLVTSDRWLREYGRGYPDLVGRNHYQVHPDLPEAWKAVHRQGLAGATLGQDEDLWVQADGSRHWLRWAVLPWTDEDGTVGGIIISAEDITARKRAELAMAEREAQYRAVIETAADGFWMLDGEGRLLAVNDAYVRRSGYSRAELLGMGIGELDAVESPEAVRVHVAKVRREGSDLFETRHRTRSGEVWPVEIHATYSATAGGLFFAFVRDIGERKRTEAELQALRAEMEQLTQFHVVSQTAAAIAHELNQPLNAVTSYNEAALRLLRAGNPRPDRLRHALERSAQQAQRAGQVMRELLAFMRQGEVQTEPIDLNDLVQQVLGRLTAGGEGGLQVRLELAPGLPPVSANRLQVEKVLANLIENGAEAMAEAGVDARRITITVHTAADAGMAQATVTDSGPGVDAAVLHRIFDPFFTTKPKGLGMGLAISRAIVESHGGQLWVESEPGAGARFHFTLPFAP